MFVGDEYAVLRAVAGSLPSPLRGQLLLTVPRAMRRLRRSHERIVHGAAGAGGQISRRLRAMTPLALEAVFDPRPPVFRVVSEEELTPAIAVVAEEAASKGIPLTPLGAELAAAARVFDVTIWLGHDSNLPRWAIAGPSLNGVRWRRVSELVATPDH